MEEGQLAELPGTACVAPSRIGERGRGIARLPSGDRPAHCGPSKRAASPVDRLVGA